MATADRASSLGFRPPAAPWWRTLWNGTTPFTSALTLSAAAVLLLWPALWNRYPIVFADTGTYLSQAIDHYAGWDRPVFYSLAILPLHWQLSLWPIVIAQALLTAWLLRHICRTFAPSLSGAAFLPLIAALSLATWLPWLVSEVMPDLFTPLLVLLLTTPAPSLVLVALAAFMIATQLSSLPLSVAVIAGLALLRRPRLRVLLAPTLAALALCTVNLAAHHRFAIAPFGDTFYLARLLYDGPGQVALEKSCPQSGWRLCSEPLPANSDDFLWRSDSPLYKDGGPKHFAAEAGAIIHTAIALDPAGVARSAVSNAFRQFASFASGDGLMPWPHEVTPVLERHFPQEEVTRYRSARQQSLHLQSNELTLPLGLATLHWLTALAGSAACLFLLPRRRTRPLLAAILIAIPISAATTGILSGPHDRYQARLMWLPPFAAVLALAAPRPRAT